MSSTHDFKRGDLVYVNGLPAIVYYVSPLQMRVLMLKYLEIDSIMDFLHEIGEQKK